MANQEIPRAKTKPGRFLSLKRRRKGLRAKLAYHSIQAICAGFNGPSPVLALEGSDSSWYQGFFTCGSE
jgi:hypothetical protein